MRWPVLAIVAAVVAIGSPGNAAKKPWRSLVLISAATGRVDRSFPDLPVTDAVADSRSGWFAAVGRRVVRLSSDGRVDRSWHTQLGGKLVQHIARSGTRLYASDSGNIYAIDARSGRVLWNRATPAQVRAIAPAGANLYVAGKFKYFDGRPRDGLAALDARTGKLSSWHGPPAVREGSTAGYFDSLAIDGARLVVGGVFSRIGGQSHLNLALLSRRNGRLLHWRPIPASVRGLAVPGDVDTIFVWHGTLLTAGYDGFGIFSTKTGRIRPWMKRIDGVATSFAGRGPIVYLGGDIRHTFQAVDGNARYDLAAFNLETGKFTPWAPKVARYVAAMKIVPSGKRVLVAGFFSSTLG